MKKGLLLVMALILAGAFLAGCGDRIAEDEAKGIVFSEDRKTLIRYNEDLPDSSYSIPKGVTSIGDMAFAGCKNLKHAKIPDSVTSIGDDAFVGCWRLTGIAIPDRVTSIGEEAFRDCKRLTSITIPDGVTSIGYGAFWGCSNLETVSLPRGVKLDKNVFCGCPKVKITYR